MKIERLRKSHKKEIIIGVILTVVIGGALTFRLTHSKYRYTQSIDLAEGVIHYKVPDFQIIAMYQQKEGQTCTEDSCYDEITGRMPSSGYIIDENKSYCTLNGVKDEDAILKTISGNHVISNLIKGDKCYLYFVKVMTTNELIAIVAAKSHGIKSSFNEVATTNEGIFQVSDGMYGGISYYWRGAVNDNHVIFANQCWRIIRINGDGTLRMIYNGDIQSSNTCPDNGANVQISWTDNGTLKNTTSYHATDLNNSTWVGWTYNDSGSGLQRPSESINDGTVGTTNTIKEITENWYYTNIEYTNSPYTNKVSLGKYCNDRESSYWIAVGGNFYYAAYYRVYSTHQPTLNCSNKGDIYEVKVALITADEVMFAGGRGGAANNNYWLQSNGRYWTMTPNNAGNGCAYVFYVHSDGALNNMDTRNTFNVRPVINLKSDVNFSSGDGTKDSPYMVAN